MINIEPLKTLDEMEKIWDKATNEMRSWDIEDDGYYTNYLYVDYRERDIDSSALKEIFKSDDPEQAFYEKLFEWEIDVDVYDINDYEENLFGYLSDEDRELTEDYYRDEFDDWRMEHVSFVYNPEDFNVNYKVNIVVDTGNADYDFGCDSILNWYGTQLKTCQIDDHSSIKWLAKQQKKWIETQKEIKYVYQNSQRSERCKDKFIDSVITELENLPCYCGMLTFLVEMPLLDILKLKREINEKHDGKITISKDTMCGLFESWNGSGSVLEIELEHDVIVPLNMIYDAWIDGTKPHGYDIDEVYGLVGSAWHGEVTMEIETDAAQDGI